MIVENDTKYRVKVGFLKLRGVGRSSFCRDTMCHDLMVHVVVFPVEPRPFLATVVREVRYSYSNTVTLSYSSSGIMFPSWRE